MVSAKQRANWARFAKMARAKAGKRKRKSTPRRATPMAKRKRGKSKQKGRGGRSKKATSVSMMGGGLVSGYEFATYDLWGQPVFTRALGAVTGDKAQLAALKTAKMLPIVIKTTKPLQYAVLIQVGRKVPGVKKLVHVGDGIVRDLLGKGWKA